jgi:DNA-binding NarL/FixJ family response regulator
LGLLKVVLCDDHPIWRSGLRAALSDGFWIAAEADTAPSAIAAIDAHQPDLAVCDLHMPGGGGLAVVRARAATTPILMLTVSESERDVLDCVVAGAVGYLTKSTPRDVLADGLRAAAAGEPVFSPGLAALVLSEFRRLGQATTPVGQLSDREREVLVLIARGRTYRQVGDALFISPKTAENHVRNILSKLHLNGRRDLARYALEHGLDTTIATPTHDAEATP